MEMIARIRQGGTKSLLAPTSCSHFGHEATTRTNLTEALGSRTVPWGGGGGYWIFTAVAQSAANDLSPPPGLLHFWLGATISVLSCTSFVYNFSRFLSPKVILRHAPVWAESFGLRAPCCRSPSMNSFRAKILPANSIFVSAREFSVALRKDSA